MGSASMFVMSGDQMSKWVIANFVFGIGMIGLSASTFAQSACQIRVYRDCMTQEQAKPSPVRERARVSAAEFCSLVALSECPSSQ